MSVPFRSVDARALATALASEDIAVPAPLTKVVAIADAADAAKQRPCRRALDLDLDAGELLAHAMALVIYDTERLADQLVYIADQAALEAAEELRTGAIDPAIVALRPTFDQAAKVVQEATKLGVAPGMTAEQMYEAGIDITVRHALRDATRRLDEIATLRVLMCRVLDLAPTLGDVRRVAGPSLDVTAVDFSACFVAGDGWSADGSAYIGRRPGGGLDWLKLAPGGLHLATTAEVTAKFARRATATTVVPLNEDPRAVLTVR